MPRVTERVYYNHFRGERLEHFRELNLVRMPKGCVAVTSCTIVQEMGNGSNATHTAYAFCSKHDQFSKKLGRKMAEARARFLLYVDTHSSLGDALAVNMKDVLAPVEEPPQTEPQVAGQ